MTIKELMKTPRMYYLPMDNYNQLHGLRHMIHKLVKPDFVIVEVGSFSGVSSSLFARYCKTLYCVDLWDLPENREYSDLIQKSLNNFEKVKEEHGNIIQIKQPSKDAADGFDELSIDLVYIDACHDYSCVKRDIAAWEPKIKHRGYLTGHDINLPGVKRAVEEVIAENYKTYKDSSWSYQKI